jgi:hypothetical protein
MLITATTLELALRRLLAGPLRYTRDYPLPVLRVAWRSTGLRQEDLYQALTRLEALGQLAFMLGDAGERFRLTHAGAIDLQLHRGPAWQRWHDRWTLRRLQRRHLRPPSLSEIIRRHSDLLAPELTV